MKITSLVRRLSAFPWLILALVLSPPLAASDDEALKVDTSGKTLQQVVQALANEHGVQLSMKSDLQGEVPVGPLSGTLDSIFTRLLKEYNYVLGYDAEGHIASVTVISSRGTETTVDESFLPTGEMMSDQE